MILVGEDSVIVHSSGKKFHLTEGGLRDDSIDDSIEMGPSLKIPRICLQDYLFIAHPFDKSERTGSDGISVEGSGIDVFFFKTMFGENPYSPGSQSRGKGLFVGDPKGVRIYDLYLFDQFIVASAYGLGLLIHNFIIGKFYILSAERFPIVPEYPSPEKEGDLRFRSRSNLPGFCKVPYKSLEISVIFDQAVKDEAIDIARSGVLGQDRIEIRSVSDRTDNQLVDQRGRAGTHKDKIDPEKD